MPASAAVRFELALLALVIGGASCSAMDDGAALRGSGAVMAKFATELDGSPTERTASHDAPTEDAAAGVIATAGEDDLTDFGLPDAGPSDPDGIWFYCCCVCEGRLGGAPVLVSERSWAFEIGSDACLPSCFDRIRSRLGVSNLNGICTRRYEGERC